MSDLGAMANPDESFDRFARLVQGALGVPVALVSLAGDAEQVFPGAVGLPEPWQSLRRTPLSHSFCQHVVASGGPLITSDAREVPELAGNLAIPDLGVIAYAGMPLTEGERTVGSLCAIDSAIREWTAVELAFLTDLAAACSAELALRAARREAERAWAEADRQAARTHLMLALSESLFATTTVDDVITTSVALAKEHLDAADVQVLLAGGPAGPVPDLAPDGLGRVGVPVPGTNGPLGLLTLTAGPSAPEPALVEALARYTGAAVERARLLQERRETATALQLAMLPTPPVFAEPARFEVRARYVPIARGNQVGGDWYDAQLGGDVLRLVIGDVTGHDIEAAAKMGQLRSFVRAIGADRDRTPSSVLTVVDGLLHDLRLDLVASTQIVHVTPEDDGTAVVRWSSAGHPAPVVLGSDGAATVLTEEPDLLLGVMPETPRHDRHLVLEPGAALLLYTDGLVERRGRPFRAGQQVLAAAVGELGAADPDVFLDVLLERLLGPGSTDDCAVLAVHNPARAVRRGSPGVPGDPGTPGPPSSSRPRP